MRGGGGDWVGGVSSIQFDFWNLFNFAKTLTCKITGRGCHRTHGIHAHRQLVHDSWKSTRLSEHGSMNRDHTEFSDAWFLADPCETRAFEVQEHKRLTRLHDGDCRAESSICISIVNLGECLIECGIVITQQYIFLLNIRRLLYFWSIVLHDTCFVVQLIFKSIE